MAEVAIGEGLAAVEAAPPPVADKPISFRDEDASADPASAILDEVLAGEAPAAETPPAGEAAAKPEPAPAEPAADTPDSAKLRKGFAKLAEDRRRLLELQQSARQERAAAAQYAEKAAAHDKLVERLRTDPAAVIAELGDELVNKTLQGFIDREKSPAEREVARMRADLERDKAAALQREQEQVAAQWRAEQIARVKADERFDLVNTLGLHNDVIDVMTSYYEKHSERDDKGNVVVPAILPWDQAAQAVEDHRAAMIEKSKRYGKRAPAAEEKKDAPPAKATPAAPAKKPPTSLSSVPVAEGPSREEELPLDDLDERERRVLASLGY